MSNQTFEFWYDYKKQNNILRFSLLSALGILVLSLVVILSLAHRKPFVIRVASNGETSIIDDSNPYARANGEEAKYFTEQFLKLYLAPDSESVSKDLAVALAWMVPDLQAKSAQAYVDQQYVTQIKEQKVQSQLYLNTMASNEDGDGYFVLTKGIVETFKKDTQVSMKHNFEARLRLQHTSRSAYNPQGLLVSRIDVVYREEPLYKDIREVPEDKYVENDE